MASSPRRPRACHATCRRSRCPDYSRHPPRLAITAIAMTIAGAIMASLLNLNTSNFHSKIFNDSTNNQHIGIVGNIPWKIQRASAWTTISRRRISVNAPQSSREQRPLPFLQQPAGSSENSQFSTQNRQRPRLPRGFRRLIGLQDRPGNIDENTNEEDANSYNENAAGNDAIEAPSAETTDPEKEAVANFFEKAKEAWKGAQAAASSTLEKGSEVAENESDTQSESSLGKKVGSVSETLKDTGTMESVASGEVAGSKASENKYVFPPFTGNVAPLKGGVKGADADGSKNTFLGKKSGAALPKMGPGKSGISSGTFSSSLKTPLDGGTFPKIAATNTNSENNGVKKGSGSPPKFPGFNMPLKGASSPNLKGNENMGTSKEMWDAKEGTAANFLSGLKMPMEGVVGKVEDVSKTNEGDGKGEFGSSFPSSLQTPLKGSTLGSTSAGRKLEDISKGVEKSKGDFGASFPSGLSIPPKSTSEPKIPGTSFPSGLKMPLKGTSTPNMVSRKSQDDSIGGEQKKEVSGSPFIPGLKTPLKGTESQKTGDKSDDVGKSVMVNKVGVGTSFFPGMKFSQKDAPPPKIYADDTINSDKDSEKSSTGPGSTFVPSLKMSSKDTPSPKTFQQENKGSEGPTSFPSVKMPLNGSSLPKSEGGESTGIDKGGKGFSIPFKGTSFPKFQGVKTAGFIKSSGSFSGGINNPLKGAQLSKAAELKSQGKEVVSEGKEGGNVGFFGASFSGLKQPKGSSLSEDDGGKSAKIGSKMGAVGLKFPKANVFKQDGNSLDSGKGSFLPGLKSFSKNPNSMNNKIPKTPGVGGDKDSFFLKSKPEGNATGGSLPLKKSVHAKIEYNATSRSPGATEGSVSEENQLDGNLTNSSDDEPLDSTNATGDGATLSKTILKIADAEILTSNEEKILSMPVSVITNVGAGDDDEENEVTTATYVREEDSPLAENVSQVFRFDPSSLGKGDSFRGSVSSRVYGLGVGGDRLPNPGGPIFPKERPAQLKGPSAAFSVSDSKEQKFGLQKNATTSNSTKPIATTTVVAAQNRTGQTDQAANPMSSSNSNVGVAGNVTSKASPASGSEIKDDTLNTGPEMKKPTVLELADLTVERDREAWIKEQNKLASERYLARVAEEQRAKQDSGVPIVSLDETVEESKIEGVAEDATNNVLDEKEVAAEREREAWIQEQNQLAKERYAAMIAEEKCLKADIDPVGHKEEIVAEREREAWILEQNQLAKERYAARIAEEKRLTSEIDAVSGESGNLKEQEISAENSGLKHENVSKESKEDEINRVRLELEKLKDELNAVEQQRMDVERIKREMKESHNAELEQLKSELMTMMRSNETKNIEKVRSEVMAQSSRTMQEKLQELSISHSKELENLKSALRKQRQLEVERVTNELTNAHLDEMERLKASTNVSQSEQIKKLENAHTMELERVRSEMDASASKYLAEELHKISVTHSKQLDELKKELSEKDAVSSDSVRSESMPRSSDDNDSSTEMDAREMLSSIHDISPLHDLVTAAPDPASEGMNYSQKNQTTSLNEGPSGVVPAEIPKYDTLSRGASIPGQSAASLLPPRNVTSTGDGVDPPAPSTPKSNSEQDTLSTDIEALELVPMCRAIFDPNSPSLDFEEMESLNKYFGDGSSGMIFEEETCHLPSEYPFVSLLRDSSPYIVNHRHSTVVYHIPGDLIYDRQKFDSVMDDIALTWLFGMKIVICVGCRKQIVERLERNERLHGSIGNNEDVTSSSVGLPGVRITTPTTLRILEEEAGFCRFEVERQLNRHLRNKGADCNVVSGCFITGKKYGIVDGVDYQLTGYPTHMQTDKINRFHSRNDVVLLTPLGFTKDGDAVNIHSEALAAFTAGALEASKVVYFSSHPMVLRGDGPDGNQRIQMIQRSHAVQMLSHYGLKVDKRGFPHWSNSALAGTDVSHARAEKLDYQQQLMLLKVGWATHALESGVERAHIVTSEDGALLEELFTPRRGYGTCISQDDYQAPHPEDFNDDLSALDGVGAGMVEW